MGWVLSCETGLSGVPIHFSDEKATSSHATDGEYGMDLAQSETPCTWRCPLYGTWEISFPARCGMPGRFMKGNTER